MPLGSELFSCFTISKYIRVRTQSCASRIRIKMISTSRSPWLVGYNAGLRCQTKINRIRIIEQSIRFVKLHDVSFVHAKYSIRIGNRVQSMGDGYDCWIAKFFTDGLLNERIRLKRCWLIELSQFDIEMHEQGQKHLPHSQWKQLLRQAQEFWISSAMLCQGNNFWISQWKMWLICNQYEKLHWPCQTN